MVALSTDRLLAVQKALSYRLYTSSYAVYTLLACLVPAVAYVLVAIARLLMDDGILSAVPARYTHIRIFVPMK